MFMLFAVAAQMLVHQSAVQVHMLMNQIRIQEQVKIVEHIYCGTIHSYAEIFSHDNSPFADALYYLQFVCGCDYGLPCTRQLLQKLNQPEGCPGIQSC